MPDINIRLGATLDTFPRQAPSFFKQQNFRVAVACSSVCYATYHAIVIFREIAMRTARRPAA